MGDEKKSNPGKAGSLVAGILLGMILGLAAAAAVAWYVIKKNPSSFENKERNESVNQEPQSVEPPALVPPLAEVSAPAPASAVLTASGASETQQHFEFYKVLTDKQDKQAASNSKPATPAKSAPVSLEPAKPVQPASAQVESKPVEAKPVETREIYYVQAGSFPNEVDGENLKAKLAMMGLEANLQTAVIPDRGTFHRVRLGPYDSSAEMNKVLAVLKEHGILDAAPIKVQ